MAYLENFILQLLIMVVLVSADEKFMKIQCHNSETPEICMQCLKSDTKSSGSDEIGIASVVTGCLSKHSKNLAANITELMKGETDKKLISAYEACIKGYNGAVEELAKVIYCLNNGDYDKAGSFVLAALLFQLNCRQSISDNVKCLQRPLPNKISYEMKAYEYLSEAAMRIIDRL